MTYALGRRVNHDPRSRAYPVRVAPLEARAAGATIAWSRRFGVLDQGQLGSCTGNAALGALGTDPYFATVSGVAWTETDAVSIYSDATKIDTAPGTYPPTDTGSDGVSVAKVLKGRGWISGYEHAFTIDQLFAALARGPVIVGTNWYQGMFTPDAQGLLSISGQVAGGHEYVIDGWNADHGLFRMTNSWGTSWGLAGSAWLEQSTLTRLLAEQGDVTSFVPLTQPAPVPTPTPAPPGPTQDIDPALWHDLEPWTTARHTGANKRAAATVAAWARLKGYTT